jgi:hypothetical protein
VAEHLDGDAARFEELWERLPGLAQTVRDLTRDIGDVHWKSRTQDGWYCVQAGSEYAVYYQERGIVSDRRAFSSEAAAATYFLRTLGYLDEGSPREQRFNAFIAEAPSRTQLTRRTPVIRRSSHAPFPLHSAPAVRAPDDTERKNA